MTRFEPGGRIWFPGVLTSAAPSTKRGDGGQGIWPWLMQPGWLFGKQPHGLLQAGDGDRKHTVLHDIADQPD